MSQIRVLLIEDEDDQAELVIDIFHMEGDFEVKRLTDFDKLLETMLEFQPQIIVTDIALPGLDGFDVIRVLHKNFPNVKILAYSAHAIPSQFKAFHENTIALGATEFIGKPYDIDNFLDKIRGMM